MKFSLSISAQILLAVLVTAISVLGFSSIIDLNGLKQRSTQALQDKGAKTADRIANSLAYPLWNLNRDETERVVLDELASADVSEVRVFDEHGAPYVSKIRGQDGRVRDSADGGVSASAALPVLYSFTRDVSFKNTAIGRVTLNVTDAPLQAELRDLRRATATKLVVLVVLLSLVLFVALRVLVIRPVSTLQSWVETMPVASAERVLAPRFTHSGEINSLAQAFDRLSQDLRRQNDELESRHAHLRESEERYRTLADTATDAIVTIDHHSTILFANAAVEKVFGVAAPDLIGDRLTTLMPEYLRHVHEASLQRYVDTGKRHVAWEAVELTGLHKAGHTILLEVSFGEFKREGAHLFTGIIRDITQRKQAEIALRESEERFSKAFGLAPYRMGIVRISDEVVVDVNEHWLKDAGLRRADIINRPIAELPAWIGDEMRSALRQMATGGAALRDAEVQGHGRTGNARVTLASAEVIDLHGERAMLWAASDITERKQAEEALVRSTAQLRALSARLQSAREEEGTRIAREIHDEMGSGLTSLKWDLERLADNLPAPEDGSWVLDARARIGSMTRLIEATVNTVRRISSELRPGILDDLGLVAAIEWQAQQFQARTGITYHADLAVEATDVNRETSTAVFRIFQEILTNVMRHARASSFYVKLWEREGYLGLEVRDDGRGITDSEIGNTRSLGLLGMKERALLVGGDLRIDGRTGQGTTVVVRFPLAA